MPYAFLRRALWQLALAGFAVCFNAGLSAHALAQAPGDAEPPAAESNLESDSDTGAEQVSPLVLHQRKTLQSSLEQVNRDRDQVNTLWPWLVTGIGAGMVIVGLILGIESSVGCGDSCKGGSPAPAWLAVLGTTVGTSGLIWTLNTERDIDRIDSREYRIRSELERLDWHTSPRQQSTVSPRLSLRGSF